MGGAARPSRGGQLFCPRGNSSVVFLYHTIEVWGIGGDDVGLIQSTKAPPRLPMLGEIISGVRIHPENTRTSGRHGVQYVAQCVACAALTLDVWQ